MIFHFLFSFFFAATVVIGNTIDCFKLNLRINFSKDADLHVRLVPNFKIYLHTLIVQEIKVTEKIVNSNCTKCQIEIEEEIQILGNYWPEKIQFEFEIHTKTTSEMIVRHFELFVYNPNIKKVLDLNLGNLTTRGKVEKSVIFGEMVPENVLLVGALFVDLDKTNLSPNRRTKEVVHLGTEQIEIKRGNSNVPFYGTFNLNVNLPNVNGAINKMNLKILKFIEFKNENNEFDTCQIGLQDFQENSQIVQMHSNINNNNDNSSEKHLSHRDCIINSIKTDNIKCLCGFKLYEQRFFNLPPFLTENNNGNVQQQQPGILHWNYQQKLSKIMDHEQKGTFKYRQAAGALNEINEYIRELNDKIAEFFGGKGYLNKLTLKQQNDNNKIASVDTVKNLLKLISKVEPAGQNANDLLEHVENVDQVLEAIAKQAFDTMEMMAENE